MPALVPDIPVLSGNPFAVTPGPDAVVDTGSPAVPESAGETAPLVTAPTAPLVEILPREEEKTPPLGKALVRWSVLGASLAAGIAMAFRLQDRAANPPATTIVEEPAAPIIPAPPGFTPLVSGEKLHFAAQNCAFTIPGAPWWTVQRDALRNRPVLSMERHAAAPAVNGLGEAGFLLHVEEVGVESGTTRQKAASMTERTSRVLSPGCRIRVREEVRRGDLVFTRLKIDQFVARGRRWNAEVWHYEHNGVLYQLLTLLPENAPETVLAETARGMADAFSIMDPGRMVRLSEVAARKKSVSGRPAQEWKEAPEPVTLEMPLEGWEIWEGAGEILTGCEFAAMRPGGDRIAVAVVPVDSLPEDAMLARALPEVWSPLRNCRLSAPSEFSQGSARGVRITGSGAVGESDGPLEVRVLRCGTAAVICLAQARAGQESMPAELLNALTFSGPVTDQITQGVDRRSLLHRLLLRSGATMHARDGRSEPAAELLLASWRQYQDIDDLFKAASTLAASGQLQRALQLVAEQAPRLEHRSDFVVRRAMLLAETGHAEEAHDAAADLLMKGRFPLAMGITYADTLIRQKAWPQALSFAENVASRERDPVWRLVGVKALARKGDRTAAVKMAESLTHQHPADTDLAEQCVHTLLEASLYTEARDMAQKLVATSGRTSRTLVLLGSCLAALSHATEARESFQAALELDPECSVAREALEDLAASTGQHDRRALSENIPQVPLPDAISRVIPQPPAAAPVEGAHVLHLRRVTGVEVRAGQPVRTTVRGSVRILDEQGMASFNTLRIPVDPLSQRVCVHWVRVTDVAGSTVTEASLADHYSMDESDASRMATSAKLIHIPVPGLKPGSVLDYSWTVENMAASEGIEYTRHIFALTEPCLADVWYMRGDASRVVFRHSQADTAIRGDDFTGWVETSPALLDDQGQPTSPGDVPVIHAGTPGRTWQDLAGNYLNQIRDALKDDPSIPATAARITGGLNTPQEKMLALSRFVRDEISYSAIEFGARAVIPHAAGRTLANRYGDCKDHSVLLQRLLHAAGIRAHLALISTRGDVEAEFPSFAQFDHMIVAVPTASGKLDFIDCTNKYLEPATGFAPVSLEARRALILDPEAPSLMSTPPASPLTTAEAQRSATLSGKDATIQEKITVTGSGAALLRSYFCQTPEHDRPALYRRLMQFDRIRHSLEEFALDDLKDPSLPLVIRTRWQARGCCRRTGDTVHLTLPAPCEAHLLCPPEAGGERTAPWFQASAVELKSSIHLVLPAELDLGNLPASPARGQSTFGTWAVEAVPGAGSMPRIDFHASLKAGLRTADEFNAIVDFTRDSLSSYAGDWTLVTAPAPAAAAR